MKQPEYIEGPLVLENFEKMATAIHHSPKLAEGRRKSLAKRLANASLKTSTRTRTALGLLFPSLSFRDEASPSYA